MPILRESDFSGGIGHIPARIKSRVVVQDNRGVQVRVFEECLGVIHLMVDTGNAEIGLFVGETGIRELADRFAAAVARMDARAAEDAERAAVA